jgi:molybdopterin converting factor small subunit
MRAEGQEVYSVGKVKLRIPQFVAYMINPGATEDFVLERELGKETTVSGLLTEFALNNSTFRQIVFNPDAGMISDQLNIVLNQQLLHLPTEMDTRLNDGDVVTLIPVYTGG